MGEMRFADVYRDRCDHSDDRREKQKKSDRERPPRYASDKRIGYERQDAADQRGGHQDGKNQIRQTDPRTHYGE
jgi:hypothetical protein